MKITINKKDLSNILVWASSAQVRARSVGIPFEDDEENTYKKLKGIQSKNRNTINRNGGNYENHTSNSISN